jgi:hypothetical protein
MDSRTHVELANRLLASCNASQELTLASLFPQIDRWPHTLHRMYAHNVFKAKSITEIGLHVMADDKWDDPANAYEVKRFKDERQRYLSYLDTASWRPGLGMDEQEAAVMSYVSHIYLDTYNQPAQPFAPLSVYCSGQWSLWEKLGDFRRTLYTTNVINELRADLFADRLWASVPAMSANALTQAMLVRMCHHSLDRIGEDVIPVAMRALSLAPCAASELSTAVAFLREFEDLLNTKHIRHLAGKSINIGFAASVPAEPVMA